MRKYVRFAIVAYDVTPTTSKGEMIVNNILTKRNLISRMFEEGKITKQSILKLEASLKKFITPELLKEMTDEIKKEK